MKVWGTVFRWAAESCKDGCQVHAHFAAVGEEMKSTNLYWVVYFLQYRLKCQINKRRLAVVCALHVCYHSWCFACGRKTWLATSIWSTVYWTADFTSWLPLVEECRNTQSAVCKDHLSLFPILQSNRLLYESLEDTQSKMATPRTVIWSDKLQLVLLIGEKYGSSVYLLSVSAD